MANIKNSVLFQSCLLNPFSRNKSIYNKFYMWFWGFRASVLSDFVPIYTANLGPTFTKMLLIVAANINKYFSFCAFLN